MQDISPRVVEIVGPAGAGKTTLCNVLTGICDQILLSNFPDVRKFKDAPFFLWNGLCLARLYQFGRVNGSSLSKRQFAWMSILRGWPPRLRRTARDHSKIIVLDHGPAYLLAEISEFGPSYLQSPRYEKLWENLYSRWADTLDTIVWLDAGNEHLLRRIRTRGDEHIVKHSSDAVVIDFLSRFRAAYDRVISRLTAGNAGPRVLRFDTGASQTSDIASLIIDTFAIDPSWRSHSRNQI